MKISAIFENIDAADQAVHRLRESGISVRHPHTSLVSENALPHYREHFLAFPTAYDPLQMVHPFTTPGLDPFVIRTPNDLSANISAETQLLIEVPDRESDRARDILLNMHGTGLGMH